MLVCESRTRVLSALTLFATAVACDEPRDRPAREPVFDRDIRPPFEMHCDSCHRGEDAEGGWRSTSYLDVIACVGQDQTSAVRPPDATAPLLEVLKNPSHPDGVPNEDFAVIEAWVFAGAPAFRGTVHSS